MYTFLLAVHTRLWFVTHTYVFPSGSQSGCARGKKTEREKRRQKMWNENEVRREISREGGKMQGW